LSSMYSALYDSCVCDAKSKPKSKVVVLHAPSAAVPWLMHTLNVHNCYYTPMAVS
jgi:hypothetical protein